MPVQDNCVYDFVGEVSRGVNVYMLDTGRDVPGSYVYSNSVSHSAMGFPGGTSNYFINTGIHSPQKYPAEPFRWAREDPPKNHDIDNVEAVTANIGAITTFAAAASVCTVQPTPIALSSSST